LVLCYAELPFSPPAEDSLDKQDVREYWFLFNRSKKSLKWSFCFNAWVLL